MQAPAFKNRLPLSGPPLLLHGVLLLLALSFLSAGVLPQWINQDADSIELSEEYGKDTDAEKKDNKEKERTIDDYIPLVPLSAVAGRLASRSIPDTGTPNWFQPYIATFTPPPEQG
ncbi:MAG: hypothetical protein EP344_13840 [Bacteroidetes bacterium]|nr:MAG: hypothetical protein EP344_13840 [Bacteroidota bacterium]